METIDTTSPLLDKKAPLGVVRPAGSFVKVYLAARWTRRDELRNYAADLIVRDHAITSRWLFNDHGSDADMEYAMEDMEDVLSSDIVISFTEDPACNRGGRNRGGRHVEFGVALGRGIACLVVGPRENVFHYLPGVIVYPDWPACMRRFAIEPSLVDGATRAYGRYAHQQRRGFGPAREE